MKDTYLIFFIKNVGLFIYRKPYLKYDLNNFFPFSREKYLLVIVIKTTYNLNQSLDFLFSHKSPSIIL